NTTAMPVLIAFAAAGLLSLQTLLRNAGSRWTAVLLTIAAAALMAVMRARLIPYLLFYQVAFDQNPQTALILQCALRAIVYAIFAALAFAAINHVSGYRRLSRIFLLASWLVLLPAVCLPVRALGRWWEWPCPLAYKGQLIEQIINLPQPLSAASNYQGVYLMIDTDKASTLNNLAVSVNGVPLTGPFIPGLAMVQEFHNLHHVADGKIYWEGESMFNYLARPADLTNLDLRQWMLVPLPANLARQCFIDKQCKVDLTVKEPGGAIFGAYQIKANRHDIPSPAVYSWEKAFYGVEAENGTTDPRLDDRVLNAGTGIARDLSPAAGTQSGFYNIRLLVNDDKRKPEEAGAGLIKRTPLKLTVLSERENEGDSFAIRTIPPYRRGDLWLMRVHGKLRALCGKPNPSVTITVQSRDPKNNQLCSYESVWTARSLRTGAAEQEFDFAAPLSPAELPGKIVAINTTFNIATSQWKSERKESLEEAQLEGKEIIFDLIRLPAPPFQPGHRVI
ncbi:MAG TPA: hypothetical protein V6C72_18765, partial [Chroococcales cyanobacterium]